MLRKVSLVLLVLLLGTAVVLTACGGDEAPTGPEAFVNSVEVVEENGQTVAIVQGDLPDACSELAEPQQQVQGSTIRVTLTVTQPEGMVCAQVLTPFEERVVLDTAGLDPGAYSVEVNGVVAEFTLS